MPAEAVAPHRLTKASLLRVNAIHEDVKFSRTIAKAVQAELEDLTSLLGLDGVEQPR